MIEKSTEKKIAELESLVEQVKNLESRELEKNSLVGYAKFKMDNYLPPPHIKLLASKLEAVEKGEIKRLAIFMPPRHGKSILTSEFFPAWYMGRNPDKYIICSTYAQDLADDFGRKVRNQLQDKRYTDKFPRIWLINGADQTINRGICRLNLRNNQRTITANRNKYSRKWFWWFCCVHAGNSPWHYI